METYTQSIAVANIRSHVSVNYLHIRHKRVEEQVNIMRFGVFTAGWLRIYILRDVTVCLSFGGCFRKLSMTSS